MRCEKCKALLIEQSEILYCYKCGAPLSPAKALTLEDLLEIDGEHIWLVDKSRDMPYSGIALIKDKKLYYFWWSEYAPVGSASWDLTNPYYKKWFNKEWFAYDREPEEADDEQTP